MKPLIIKLLFILFISGCSLQKFKTSFVPQETYYEDTVNNDPKKSNERYKPDYYRGF